MAADEGVSAMAVSTTPPADRSYYDTLRHPTPSQAATTLQRHHSHAPSYRHEFLKAILHISSRGDTTAELAALVLFADALIEAGAGQILRGKLAVAQPVTAERANGELTRTKLRRLLDGCPRLVVRQASKQPVAVCFILKANAKVLHCICRSFRRCSGRAKGATWPHMVWF
jgi:hypothetical protein